MSAGELKFLVDVGVGKKVEEYLLEKRYDIKAVRSLDQRMPDQEIIRLAALEKRIVITMDELKENLIEIYNDINKDGFVKSLNFDFCSLQHIEITSP